MSSYMMVPEGYEALAQSLVRLRRRQAAARRLSHAQPPERERRSDVRAHASLYSAHRTAVHPGAEGELRARRHQRRELGHLRQRAAVQQRLHARQLQDDQGRALEGARPPRWSRRHGVRWRDDASAYKRDVRNQNERRFEVVGRPDSSLPRSQPDATQQARSSARSDLRYRWGAAIPGTRCRARQQRRVLDAGE